jgi:hypothetical protein
LLGGALIPVGFTIFLQLFYHALTTSFCFRPNFHHMKSKYISFLLVTFIAFPFAALAAPADYTVHEWGTFTSLQGGDGDLLSWNPLQNSDLPAFVYSNHRHGSDHQQFPFGDGKGVRPTKQRLETPVIYFYSDKRQIVDLTVKFPAGRITEWYPQAELIGPTPSA